MSLSIPIQHVNKFLTRYTRSELKNDGYSIAFFDNSALSPLGFMQENGEENKEQQFLNLCESKKIRPVLNILIIGELVKKLHDDSKFEYLKTKKITILRTLQKAGLLWSLPINGILDLERCNMQNLSPSLAHNYLYVFSEHPLCSHKKNQSLPYHCDQALNYSFHPDRATVTYNGDIEKWFKEEIIGKIQSIQAYFKEFEETIDGSIDQQEIRRV